ncbi:MAG TPA: hypothetical protein VK590_12690 [Saprospiraceae bacterium]|nr:hypothetical protein [Saprospiraceae bacterium]
MDDSVDRVIQVKNTGKDTALFKRMRKKLFIAFNKIMDATIDLDNNSTIRDEIPKITTLGLNYIKEKLKRPGIENEKYLAEIEEIYSNIDKNKADARKTNAESRQLEFDQRLKEFITIIKFSKAFCLGQENKESWIFTKEIEAFLEVVNEIEIQNKLIVPK